MGSAGFIWYSFRFAQMDRDGLRRFQMGLDWIRWIWMGSKSELQVDSDGFAHVDFGWVKMGWDRVGWIETVTGKVKICNVETMRKVGKSLLLLLLLQQWRDLINPHNAMPWQHLSQKDRWRTKIQIRIQKQKTTQEQMFTSRWYILYNIIFYISPTYHIINTSTTILQLPYQSNFDK